MTGTPTILPSSSFIARHVRRSSEEVLSHCLFTISTAIREQACIFFFVCVFKQYQTKESLPKCSLHSFTCASAVSCVFFVGVWDLKKEKMEGSSTAPFTWGTGIRESKKRRKKIMRPTRLKHMRKRSGAPSHTTQSKRCRTGLSAKLLFYLITPLCAWCCKTTKTKREKAASFSRRGKQRSQRNKRNNQKPNQRKVGQPAQLLQLPYLAEHERDSYWAECDGCAVSFTSHSSR